MPFFLCLNYPFSFLLTRLIYPQLSIPLLLFPHFFLAFLVDRSRDGWLLSLLPLDFLLFSWLLRSNCFYFFLVGVRFLWMSMLILLGLLYLLLFPNNCWVVATIIGAFWVLLELMELMTCSTWCWFFIFYLLSGCWSLMIFKMLMILLEFDDF